MPDRYVTPALKALAIAVPCWLILADRRIHLASCGCWRRDFRSALHPDARQAAETL